MEELKIFYNRCRGKSAVSHIKAAKLILNSEENSIEFPLGDDPDFAIYFEVGDSPIDEELLESARRLMSRIDDLDNQVQEVCAIECKRSGLHPRNYEGMLAFITLARGAARLRYFGTGGNIEWDEIVEDRDGVWEYVGATAPDLSARNA